MGFLRGWSELFFPKLQRLIEDQLELALSFSLAILRLAISSGLRIETRGGEASPGRAH